MRIDAALIERLRALALELKILLERHEYREFDRLSSSLLENAIQFQILLEAGLLGEMDFLFHPRANQLEWHLSFKNRLALEEVVRIMRRRVADREAAYDDFTVLAGHFLTADQDALERSHPSFYDFIRVSSARKAHHLFRAVLQRVYRYYNLQVAQETVTDPALYSILDDYIYLGTLKTDHPLRIIHDAMVFYEGAMPLFQAGGAVEPRKLYTLFHYEAANECEARFLQRIMHAYEDSLAKQLALPRLTVLDPLRWVEVLTERLAQEAIETQVHLWRSLLLSVVTYASSRYAYQHIYKTDVAPLATLSPEAQKQYLAHYALAPGTIEPVMALSIKDHLHVLDLTGTRLSDHFEAVLALVRKNRALQALRLDNTGLEDAHIESIAPLLKPSQSNQFTVPAIRELSVANNRHLTNQVAYTLGDVVAVNPELEHLDLHVEGTLEDGTPQYGLMHQRGLTYLLTQARSNPHHRLRALDFSQQNVDAGLYYDTAAWIVACMGDIPASRWSPRQIQSIMDLRLHNIPLYRSKQADSPSVKVLRENRHPKIRSDRLWRDDHSFPRTSLFFRPARMLSTEAKSTPEETLVSALPPESVIHSMIRSRRLPGFHRLSEGHKLYMSDVDLMIRYYFNTDLLASKRTYFYPSLAINLEETTNATLKEWVEHTLQPRLSDNKPAFHLIPLALQHPDHFVVLLVTTMYHRERNTYSVQSMFFDSMGVPAKGDTIPERKITRLLAHIKAAMQQTAIASRIAEHNIGYICVAWQKDDWSCGYWALHFLLAMFGSFDQLKALEPTRHITDYPATHSRRPRRALPPEDQYEVADIYFDKSEAFRSPLQSEQARQWMTTSLTAQGLLATWQAVVKEEGNQSALRAAFEAVALPYPEALPPPVPMTREPVAAQESKGETDTPPPVILPTDAFSHTLHLLICERLGADLLTDRMAYQITLARLRRRDPTFTSEEFRQLVVHGLIQTIQQAQALVPATALSDQGLDVWRTELVRQLTQQMLAIIERYRANSFYPPALTYQLLNTIADCAEAAHEENSDMGEEDAPEAQYERIAEMQLCELYISMQAVHSGRIQYVDRSVAARLFRTLGSLAKMGHVFYLAGEIGQELVSLAFHGAHRAFESAVKELARQEVFAETLGCLYEGAENALSMGHGYGTGIGKVKEWMFMQDLSSRSERVRQKLSSERQVQAVVQQLRAIVQPQLLLLSTPTGRRGGHLKKFTFAHMKVFAEWIQLTEGAWVNHPSQYLVSDAFKGLSQEKNLGGPQGRGYFSFSAHDLFFKPGLEIISHTTGETLQLYRDKASTGLGRVIPPHEPEQFGFRYALIDELQDLMAYAMCYKTRMDSIRRRVFVLPAEQLSELEKTKEALKALCPYEWTRFEAFALRVMNGERFKVFASREPVEALEEKVKTLEERFEHELREIRERVAKVETECGEMKEVIVRVGQLAEAATHRAERAEREAKEATERVNYAEAKFAQAEARADRAEAKALQIGQDLEAFKQRVGNRFGLFGSFGSGAGGRGEGIEILSGAPVGQISLGAALPG